MCQKDVDESLTLLSFKKVTIERFFLMTFLHLISLHTKRLFSVLLPINFNWNSDLARSTNAIVKTTYKGMVTILVENYFFDFNNYKASERHL